MEGHPTPHARHDGQVRRRHTSAHEENDVFVTNHGEARHKFPEASFSCPVRAVESVDHDVAMPSASATPISDGCSVNMDRTSVISPQNT